MVGLTEPRHLQKGVLQRLSYRSHVLTYGDLCTDATVVWSRCFSHPGLNLKKSKLDPTSLAQRPTESVIDYSLFLSLIRHKGSHIEGECCSLSFTWLACCC